MWASWHSQGPQPLREECHRRLAGGRDEDAAMAPKSRSDRRLITAARETPDARPRVGFPGQWQQLPPVPFFADGGTSFAGLAAKNPAGLSVKPM